jgi:CDP-glycerol glycerophosphotransferase
MPILKQCDLFILSSSNEGLPVVFFEADCLHKPILSTDIDGPHELLNKYKGGLLVEESAEALYQGMLAFDKGLVKPLDIDMEKYNEQCIREFEHLFM